MLVSLIIMLMILTIMVGIALGSIITLPFTQRGERPMRMPPALRFRWGAIRGRVTWFAIGVALAALLCMFAPRDTVFLDQPSATDRAAVSQDGD